MTEKEKQVLAGFRPCTTRSFCFGKRTQNHGRPSVATTTIDNDGIPRVARTDRGGRRGGILFAPPLLTPVWRLLWCSFLRFFCFLVVLLTRLRSADGPLSGQTHECLFNARLRGVNGVFSGGLARPYDGGTRVLSVRGWRMSTEGAGVQSASHQVLNRLYSC